jgi:hypothetical protein
LGASKEKSLGRINWGNSVRGLVAVRVNRPSRKDGTKPSKRRATV